MSAFVAVRQIVGRERTAAGLPGNLYVYRQCAAVLSTTINRLRCTKPQLKS